MMNEWTLTWHLTYAPELEASVTCTVEAEHGPDDWLWKSAVQQRSAQTEACPWVASEGRQELQSRSRAWKTPAPPEEEEEEEENLFHQTNTT